MTTPIDLLLTPTLPSLQSLHPPPTSLLLISPSSSTLRYLISALHPTCTFHTCCGFLVDCPPPNNPILCLEDVDTPDPAVEAAVKAMFTTRRSEIIIGTASSRHNVPSSLLRAGRFDKVIEIRAPTIAVRSKAWAEILKFFGHDTSIAEELAALSPGFQVEDFAHVTHEVQSRQDTSIQTLKKVVSDHRPTMTNILPFVREQEKEVEMGGYEQVKRELKRLIEWPIMRTETFKRLNIKAPRGILLHGDRGCGKTLLTKTLMNEVRCANWLFTNCTDIYSKYVGESEQNVRKLFEHARALQPCIVVLDELECIGRRDDEDGGTGVQARVVGALLTELDGVGGEQVFVIACTNDINAIDAALIRPGRLDHLVKVHKPTLEDRKAIVTLILKHTKTKGEHLVIALQNTTGAELQLICRQAAMYALESSSHPDCIEEDHFIQAISEIRSQSTA